MSWLQETTGWQVSKTPTTWLTAMNTSRQHFCDASAYLFGRVEGCCFHLYPYFRPERHTRRGSNGRCTAISVARQHHQHQQRPAMLQQCDSVRMLRTLSVEKNTTVCSQSPRRLYAPVMFLTELSTARIIPQSIRRVGFDLGIARQPSAIHEAGTCNARSS